MSQRAGMITAGLGALFVGGLLGGALTGLLLSSTTRVAAVDRGSDGSLRDEGEIVRAIQVLTEEVRLLQVARRDPAPSERQAVDSHGQPLRNEPEGLLAAIEGLTTALQRSEGRVIGGGGGQAPLVVPRRPAQRSELHDAFSTVPHEEFSRQLRFSTYQQVLDRFGAPDRALNDGSLLYTVTDGDGDEREIVFKFYDGYVFNVYY